MFKFAGVGKKGRLFLATGLCFLLILGTVLFSPVLADEVNDVNPELKFVHIEGDSDKYYADGSYTASGSFNQGDGKYEMTTNSFVAWYLQDDIAFAYKTYNIGNTEDDVITGETQIDYFDAQFKVDADGNTFLPDANASAGIMIRSGLEPNAAFVFMHVRPTRIMIVYRVRSGGNMGVSYTSFSPVYPVQLKIEKRGNVVTPSFKTKDMTDWFSISAVGMETDGSKPIYMGLSGHSCNPNIPILAKFTGFKVTGNGKLIAGGTTSENSSSEKEFVAEDPPAAENTLLRETFTDGSLTNTPATTLNPVWDNPKQNTLKLLEDGNRVWNRTFASGYDYIGDQNWTDYSASVDVCFLKECDPQLANRVKLYVRHMDIDATGYYDYAAALENGNSIALYRRWRTQDGLDIHGEKLISVTVPNYLGDDTFHNLRVDVVDNVLKVYWDGSLKINYIDNGELKINLKGCVGLMTDETAVYLDNLTVVKLEDFFGGDYDNDIGGNFDQPIPDYIIKEYANSSLPY